MSFKMRGGKKGDGKRTLGFGWRFSCEGKKRTKESGKMEGAMCDGGRAVGARFIKEVEISTDSLDVDAPDGTHGKLGHNRRGKGHDDFSLSRPRRGYSRSAVGNQMSDQSSTAMDGKGWVGGGDCWWGGRIN